VINGRPSNMDSNVAMSLTMAVLTGNQHWFVYEDRAKAFARCFDEVRDAHPPGIEIQR